MPYIDGESEEEDYIDYQHQMVGHEGKRVKEDDESYEEDQEKQKRKDSHQQDQQPREEGPLIQTMMNSSMSQQAFMPH